MRKILLLFSMCMLQLAAYAQSILKGLVRSDQGTALVGVSVSNETQKVTAQTDKDGAFALQAKVGDVITFTSVGYESSTVTLQNLSSLLVTLRALNEELEEVVVLGYGSIKKSNLTGSVSRLDKRVLETGVRSNPASALAGTIPGLRVQQVSGRPGAVPNIVLRGGTSYDGSGSPLIYCRRCSARRIPRY